LYKRYKRSIASSIVASSGSSVMALSICSFVVTVLTSLARAQRKRHTDKKRTK
jgi:hypothetical protein